MTFLVEAEDLLRDPGGALLVDTRKADAYSAGHIPGAIHLTTYDVFAAGTRPGELADFRAGIAKRYAAAGLSKERPVVVYEDATGMRAARELWLLEYLGHPDARMLHGGLNAWRAAGGALSTEPAIAAPARFEPGEVPELVVSADELHAQGRAGPIRVLDVRDAKEFAGQDNTACCARRGHLPGAAWLEWTELLDAATGRFRSPAAIRDALAKRGIAPDATLAPYCHRGARSANAYYALRHAGCARVRNFIGSFHEWSARADLPVES